MLLMGGPFVILAPVYAEAATTTPAVSAGCSVGDAYNHITGEKCPILSVTTSSSVAPTFIPGCAAGDLYSHVTGQACIASAVPVVSTLTPGCTATGAYNYLTGARCSVVASPAPVVSSIPGCTATSAYSYISGQKCTVVTTTTTTTITSTPLTSSGPTTLKVLPVALLAGGTATPGSTEPISYLQVLNEGTATTTIKGFWVKEDGNTPVNAVIGFSSVDDKGNYRTNVGGVEGNAPFVNGQAYVPSGGVIGPMQMKLFTIKAQLSAFAGQYAGTNLMLDVTGVDANAAFLNTFPIRGTTWVISQ